MLLVLLLSGTAQAASVVDYWPDELPAADYLEGGEEDAAAVMPYAAISPSYSVGTSNIQIFAGVAQKLSYGQHYVYWRESQYVYRLAYGQTLTFNGSTFTGSDIRIVSYNTYTSSGSQTTFTVTVDTAFTLSPGSYLVWSDLGDYPCLYDRRGVDYAKTACVILCSIVLYYLFHHMWSDIRQRYL